MSEESSSSVSSASSWRFPWWAGAAVAGVFAVGAAVSIAVRRAHLRKLGILPVFLEFFPTSPLSKDQVLKEVCKWDTSEQTIEEKLEFFNNFVASEDGTTPVDKSLCGLFATVVTHVPQDTKLTITLAIALMLVEESEYSGILALSVVQDSSAKAGDVTWSKAHQLLGRAASRTLHFESSIFYFNRGLAGLEPKSSFAAFLLLGKAEMLGVYALQLEKARENPRFFELLDEGRRCCLEGMALVEKHQLSAQVGANFPEYTLIDLSSTRGDLHQMIEDYERLIQRLLKAADSRHPLQIAQAYRDLAETCVFLFDEEGDASVLEMAEVNALRAVSLFGDTPGMDGLLKELLYRAETLCGIYTRQGRMEEASKAWNTCLDFVRENLTSLSGEINRPPFAQNKVLRVEKVSFVMVEKDGFVDLVVRCKRKLSSKRSWLKPGSTLSVQLLRDGVGIPKSFLERTLTETLLEHPQRTGRIVEFRVPVFLPSLKTDVIEIVCKDGDQVVSKLHQPFLTSVQTITAPHKGK